MRGRCGISNIQTLIISKGQLTSLIGNPLNYIDENDQVSVFDSKILNIVSNFIPNETIPCDDRDPPWMNSFIKNLIRAKDNFCKKFVRKSNNMYHHYAFKNLQNHLNQSIQIAKQDYVNKISLHSSSISW